MFGQNQQVPQKLGKGQKLDIVEVFDTVQGEGPWSGLPACFIRLQYCNLACFFCDTEFEKGSRWDIEDLVTAAKTLGRVVLTGGEPMRQNIVPLIARLDEESIPVQIETAGTLWVPGLEPYVEADFVKIVCSPKTPKVHPKIVEYCRDWKYIIRKGETNKRSGLPGCSTQKPGISQKLFAVNKPDREERGDVVWVQPMDEQDAWKNRENMELAANLAMQHGFRVSLQTHKILGLP